MFFSVSILLSICRHQLLAATTTKTKSQRTLKPFTTTTTSKQPLNYLSTRKTMKCLTCNGRSTNLWQLSMNSANKYKLWNNLCSRCIKKPRHVNLNKVEHARIRTVSSGGSGKGGRKETAQTVFAE